MKKSIVTGVCMLLFTAMQAQEKNKTTESAVQSSTTPGEFTFEETEYNFGTIRQGDSVVYYFKFKNTGDEPIIIKDAQGSCQCTVPEYPREAVKKGESGTIKVKFDSAGKQGKQDKTVTIYSNASNDRIVLHMKGKVEAATESTGNK